jgi:hypothetical protein
MSSATVLAQESKSLPGLSLISWGFSFPFSFLYRDPIYNLAGTSLPRLVGSLAVHVQEEKKRGEKRREEKKRGSYLRTCRCRRHLNHHCFHSS